jgi:membrane fusion protein
MAQSKDVLVLKARVPPADKNVLILERQVSPEKTVLLLENKLPPPEPRVQLPEKRVSPPLVREEPLFRPEAIAARQTQWLGTVLFAPRVSQTLFTLFAMIAIAAILALLFFSEFTRKEKITGWLVPEKGMVRVVAPQTGVITRLHVRDGDEVAEGAPLFTISKEVQSEALGNTQTEVVLQLKGRRDSLIAEADLHKQLLAAELDALTNRIAALGVEGDHLAEAIVIQRSQADVARHASERLRLLQEKALTGMAEIEAAEITELDQSAKLLDLQRELDATRLERRNLELEQQALPIRTEALLAKMNRDVFMLEQEIAEAEARREIVVSAAQAGTVTALRAEQGSSVNTTTPLLSILPAGSALTAQLFVPGKAIGFIETGQTVQLRYRSFPYQKFGHYQGVISEVSRSTVSPNELGNHLTGVTSLLRGDEPVYLVSVALEHQTVTAYGEKIALQPGMQLDADVLVDTRSLVEWVFDPLYTLTGKMGS